MVLAWNGGLPQTIAYSTTPIAQMSAGGPEYLIPDTSSGAAYRGVPQNVAHSLSFYMRSNWCTLGRISDHNPVRKCNKRNALVATCKRITYESQEVREPCLECAAQAEVRYQYALVRTQQNVL